MSVSYITCPKCGGSGKIFVPCFIGLHPETCSLCFGTGMASWGEKIGNGRRECVSTWKERPESEGGYAPEPPVCPWCGRRMSACQCEDDEVGF